LEEAAAKTRCGEGCGTCRPYLRVVAATGKTLLPVMTYEEMLAHPVDEE
jgi:NAD(P)H-nitrite reductase large subunit